MGEPVALHAVVHGRVQGVYFRSFVTQRGTELGLTGSARNLPEGTVEVWAEGDAAQLQKLLGLLAAGPPPARVEKVDTEWSEHTEGHTAFRIRY